jgi:hypothetical protein
LLFKSLIPWIFTLTIAFLRRILNVSLFLNPSMTPLNLLS